MKNKILFIQLCFITQTTACVTVTKISVLLIIMLQTRSSEPKSLCFGFFIFILPCTEIYVQSSHLFVIQIQDKKYLYSKIVKWLKNILILSSLYSYLKDYGTLTLQLDWPKTRHNSAYHFDQIINYLHRRPFILHSNNVYTNNHTDTYRQH